MRFEESRDDDQVIAQNTFRIVIMIVPCCHHYLVSVLIMRAALQDTCRMDSTTGPHALYHALKLANHNFYLFLASCSVLCFLTMPSANIYFTFKNDC